jgi:hypothetical protein
MLALGGIALMNTTQLKLLVAILLGCAVISGCPRRSTTIETIPAKLANRDGIAKLLPHDLKLDDRIPFVLDPAQARTVRDDAKTTEQTLMEMGATLNQMGQLVDKTGRRIVFQYFFLPGKFRNDTASPSSETYLHPPTEPGTIGIPYKTIISE